MDHVDPSGKELGGGGASEGYGNVPYHREEYVAGSIVAWFSLDLATLRGLRMPREATRFIAALALFKIRGLLDAPMRLRTACDLEIVPGSESDWLKRPGGDSSLPSGAELADAIKLALEEVATAGLFSNPPVTTVTYSAGKKS